MNIKTKELISRLDPNTIQCPQCKNYLNKKHFHIRASDSGRVNFCDKCSDIHEYRKSYMRK